MYHFITSCIFFIGLWPRRLPAEIGPPFQYPCFLQADRAEAEECQRLRLTDSVGLGMALASDSPIPGDQVIFREKDLAGTFHYRLYVAMPPSPGVFVKSQCFLFPMRFFSKVHVFDSQMILKMPMLRLRQGHPGSLQQGKVGGRSALPQRPRRCEDYKCWWPQPKIGRSGLESFERMPGRRICRPCGRPEAGRRCTMQR